MARRGEPDLDALVAASFTKSTPSRCWAHALSGPAARYVELVRQGVVAGRSVEITKVMTILRDEFGVATSWSSVARHLKGQCRCPTTPSSA